MTRKAAPKVCRPRVRVPAAKLHKLLGIEERPAEPTYSLAKASRMFGRGPAWGAAAVKSGTFPVDVIHMGPRPKAS
jgi:hypothetical protein